MSEPKFIEELPADSRGTRAQALLDALRANPGQWAEVERVPRNRRSAAASKGSRYNNLPDIEATTRQIGDEVVLFMRAVTR